MKVCFVYHYSYTSLMWHLVVTEFRDSKTLCQHWEEEVVVEKLTRNHKLSKDISLHDLLTMEHSPYGSRRRDEAEFNLREWGVKARISRENTNSRRFSASYIRSFREDTRSFRSNITISSTASSPGYSLRGNTSLYFPFSISVFWPQTFSLNFFQTFCRWNRPVHVLFHRCSQR